MPLVKTLHDIVTPDRLYPANGVHDLPQSVIDDVRPLGAVEDLPVETVAAPAARAVAQLKTKKGA